MTPRHRVLAVLLSLPLGACGPDSPPTERLAEVEAEHAAVGVELGPDDREKLGVELGEVASATFEPSIDGPAYVVDAQAVVGTMAELSKAEADMRASLAARKRTRELFDIDTAVSAEALETAERQAAADEAQLRIARARATLAFGAGAPWLDMARREPLLAAMSAGSTLLVSASFPSGLGGAEPTVIALRRVGDSGATSWTATELWPAPTSASIPGPTLLALLETPRGLSYGERLTASVTTGAPLTGAVVPRSAVVLAGGEPWCYVEANDALVRRRVDLGKPISAGYFQAQGFAAGERIVVSGAGLLLARELGGGADED